MFARKARIIKDLEEKLERANNRTQYWMNESADYEIRLLGALSDNQQLKAENEKLKAENKKLKAVNDSWFWRVSSLLREDYRKYQQIRLQTEMFETVAKDLHDANKRKEDLSKCFGYWLCETLRLRRQCENLKAENRKLKADNDILNDQVLSFRL